MKIDKHMRVPSWLPPALASGKGEQHRVDVVAQVLSRGVMEGALTGGDVGGAVKARGTPRRLLRSMAAAAASVRRCETRRDGAGSLCDTLLLQRRQQRQARL
jgi:hypothetical protein